MAPDVPDPDPQEERTELVRQAERIGQTYPLPLEVHKSVDKSRSDDPLSGPGYASWKLWRVCVKRGSETKCVEFLRGQGGDRDSEHLGHSWMIGLVFSRPSIPGVIYVQSESPGRIKRAFEGAHHMVDQGKTITLVPEEECNQLIRMPSIQNAVVKGGWVRIRRGHYKGDVAFVTAVKDDNVRVLVVPRISYDVGPAWTRAQPALFDANRARTIFGQDAIRQINSDERYTFQRMTFKAGLLEQVFGIKQLTSEDVYPTLEEIQLFSQSSGWDRGARDEWEANRAAAALRERDRVQILSGEFRGALGIVVNKRSDSVQIQLSHHDGNVLDEDFRLELSVDQVRRLFKLGDYVRIREGAHVGKYGYIVKTVTEGTGLLELVEWDKSQPFTPTYEPNPRQHLSVYAHSVDFAEESICFASDSEPDQLEPKTHTASVIARASGDPLSLAGRRVVVVKTNTFRGYRGVIQYTHKVHKVFGVRLDATNKIVHLSEDFLLDQLSGEQLYHFRRRPAYVRRVHLASPNGYEPPIAEPTPQWEPPPDSSTPAWDPSSTPCHDPDSISTLGCSEGGFLPPCDIPREEESDVCQPLSPAVFEEWLATVDLRGTQIIVRISGFTPRDGRRSAIRDGDIASTIGKLIETCGTSPEIEVKAMVPGARPMSVPLCFLKPVHPGGRLEEAVIFAGEYEGLRCMVGSAVGPSWEVILFDDQGCMYIVRALPEHMVRTVKRSIQPGRLSS